jgi:phosphatidylglycerophosphatase A
VIPFYVYVAIDEKWNLIDDFSGTILVCFVLFRFFDIVKPFPINLIDKKLKNGLGVVMDDLIAGLFSFLIVWITVFYIL